MHEDNRVSWNLATEAHNSHKRDQAAFFRDGGSTLYPDEIELLGDLVWQDAAASAMQRRAGYAEPRALGRDWSPAWTSATRRLRSRRQLSADSGIPATFIRSDIFDYLDATEDRFDLVFTSYGALIWLSDLKQWGRGIARVLKPGGRLVALDFHPMFSALEEGWKLTYDYMGGTRLDFGGVGDYVALSNATLTPSGWEAGVVDFENPHPSHEFCWGVSDIVMALIDGGLILRTLREYPYDNGFKRFAGHARSSPAVASSSRKECR